MPLSHQETKLHKEFLKKLSEPLSLSDFVGKKQKLNQINSKTTWKNSKMQLKRST
jgi:hypothetical protein